MRTKFRSFILFTLLSSVAIAGTGPQHYVLFFSYDSPKPSESHTFATFVEEGAPGGAMRSFTISWLPRRGGARVNPLALVTGRNYSLAETFRIAQLGDHEVVPDGPYRITDDLFSRAVKRRRQLDSGVLKYKMFDWRTRRAEYLRTRSPLAGVNCIHAVSDLSGFLETGNDHWGTEATRLVRDFMVGKKEIVGFPRTYPRIAERLGVALSGD